MHRHTTALAIVLVAAACSSQHPSDDTSDDTVGTADAPVVPHADAPVIPIPDAPVVTADASSIHDLCFPGLGDPTKPHPDYDQFHPIIGSHCAGTNHQDITGIEKVVFLGDSITKGTPPTLPWEVYREVLSAKLRTKFGAGIEITECSAWGARADDLLLPPNQQIHTCFPTVEPKRTLVVMTSGGNDMNGLLSDANNGDTLEQTMAKADVMLGLYSDALHYLKDPANFPNGSFVVFANIYEFTDGTGDLLSCPGAIFAGFGAGVAEQMRPAYVHVDEQYMRLAVETQTDMIFLLESFCGHGFHAGDPMNECYRGPNTPIWFDWSCLHPNPTGHAELADLFFKTIDE